MTRLWAVCAGFLILGYVSLGRAFSYIGFPETHIYIGEMFLGAFLLLQGRAVCDLLYRNLTGRGNLGGLCWSLVAFFCYGVFEVSHGFYAGYPLLTIIESFVFQIYPLFLFIGLYAGSREPRFLRQTIVSVAWWNCVYGMAYILVLNRIPWVMPGTSVPVFSGAGGGSLVILGLLSFELRLTKMFLPFLVNTFLLLAMQVRAEWLGFSVGLFAWGALSRRMERLAFGVASVAALLVIGYAVDFSIPAPATRGGNISFSDIVGRAVASVDPATAREFSPSAGQFAGTVSWRTRWWDAIWTSVHSDPATTVIGHGYGFPLGDLVTFLRNAEIRTPHNVFFFALGYGGWLGVCCFLTFQFALGLALWRTWLATGQPFGIVLWLVALISGFLGNVYETPFGAIPLYLLTGAALAERDTANPEVTTGIHDFELQQNEEFIEEGVAS